MPSSSDCIHWISPQNTTQISCAVKLHEKPEELSYLIQVILKTYIQTIYKMYLNCRF